MVVPDHEGPLEEFKRELGAGVLVAPVLSHEPKVEDALFRDSQGRVEDKDKVEVVRLIYFRRINRGRSAARKDRGNPRVIEGRADDNAISVREVVGPIVIAPFQNGAAGGGAQRASSADRRRACQV